MMNSRVEKFDCINKEELVAYLYKEMSGSELSFFEAHLADCQSCIDEFAELSASRYAVYEWQNVEFAPMETPVFSVPRPQVVAVQKAGWLSGLRELLSFRPAMAAAGSFAALVIAALLGYSFLVGSERANDIAAVENGETNTAERIAVSTPSRSQMNVPVSTRTGEDVTSNESPSRTSEPAFASSPEPRPTYNRQTKTRRGSSSSQAAVPTRTSYRLNDLDDTSDDGLRLADLLDEV
ncbi:MAG: zf-HC2 domain-containing protein [Acidobacteria bacterium]|nr:zf-HC2 domain-containing protein [Acidobacteriota bacterium]